MYKTINFHDFQNAFQNCNRANQFSYEALRALFDYLEELELDTGVPMELDVIALCCEFSEIEEDEGSYSEYVGDEAHIEDLIIAQLTTSVLVREG